MQKRKSTGSKAGSQRTRRQRLLHELNNSLAAVRLRLGLVTGDATCMWAQKDNLEAVVATLEEARALAAQLETEAEPARRVRRSVRIAPRG